MRSVFLAALCAASLSAADFSGIWTGQVPTRNGEFTDVAFRIVQKGAAITGKQYGDYQSSPIVEGSVTGEEIVFTVVVQEQAGNQINETKHRFTGALKDGALELSRQRLESKNAGNGGVVQFKGDSKQTLTLKRLTR